MTQNRIESATEQPAVPAILLTWLAGFRPCFTTPVWNHILVLVGGAVLAPGKRTVTQALRVMGLADRPGFGRYHEALNRGTLGRPRRGASIVAASPGGAVAQRRGWVIGIDDTIERRWGGKIRARGIYRDAVRSSHGHFVKTSGLRWLSLAVMLPIPFAGQRWALPFLTVLAPSARWSEAQRRRHKAVDRLGETGDPANQTLAAGSPRGCRRRQRFLGIGTHRRGAPVRLSDHQVASRRQLVRAGPPKRRKGQMGRPALKGKRRPKLNAVLADRKTVWTSVTLTEWYGGQTRKLEYVSRTAVWYHSGMPPAAIRWVLVRDPSGQRDAQAFLCTDLDLEPTAILQRFVCRWRIETTFQEVRQHLGVETQRQWSDLAILRTTPALLGLYSLVTVWAHGLTQKSSTVVLPHPAAWYNKHQPTFSDAIAAVRRVLWSPPSFSTCRSGSESIEIPVTLLNRFVETLCLAA